MQYLAGNARLLQRVRRGPDGVICIALRAGLPFIANTFMVNLPYIDTSIIWKAGTLHKPLMLLWIMELPQ